MKIPTQKLNNGNQIPIIGLGTYKSEKDKVGEAVRIAIQEAGYTHIDCAAIYQNEKEIGTTLSKVFSSNIKREDIFITSKLWNKKHHPENVEKACVETLENLGLEYLDLYLMHWGIAFDEKSDRKKGLVIPEKISIQETWIAIESLVKKGLVKSIGVSNFTCPMIIDLLTYAKITPAINQIEVHPYNSQEAFIKYCQNNNIHITAYSPLGAPGNSNPTAPRLLDEKIISDIASNHGKSPAQILLKWAIVRGTISIPKSVSPNRIKENIDVFDFELSDDEVLKINRLNINYRFLNPSVQWGIPYFD